MNLINLSEICDNNYTEEKLLCFLSDNRNGFQLAMFSETFFRWSQDRMYEHLEMAYIIEEILQHSTLISYKITDGEFYKKITTLELKSSNDDLLTDTLLKVCILKAIEADPDEDDLFSLNEEILEFESNLDDIEFKFQEEIGDYFANYVNAGIYEIASQYDNDDAEDEDFTLAEEGDDDDREKPNQYLLKLFMKNPEWKFTFWKSNIPGIPKDSIYHSTFCWVISEKVEVDTVLKEFSGIEHDIVFEDANLMPVNGTEIIINDSAAIDFMSLPNFNLATKFIDELIVYSQTSFLPGKKNYVSRNADAIKIYYKGFYLVFFNFRTLRHDEIKELFEYSTALHNNLGSLMGLKDDLAINWNIINDEQFEQLCYEIIYNDIRFDSLTIQKMGNSRSRDGGRDIVVYTRSINGKDKKKFIIQCKLSRASGSLSKKRLPEAANIIMEYQADGYMIMTNQLIDATLYDMLNGFAVFGTDTSINYSKLELERYLARNKWLRDKYFST
jgi:hypothetical protein